MKFDPVTRQEGLNDVLGGGNSYIFGIFTPYWENIILTNIIQRGWNHQLDVFMKS